MDREDGCKLRVEIHVQPSSPSAAQLRQSQHWDAGEGLWKEPLWFPSFVSSHRLSPIPNWDIWDRDPDPRLNTTKKGWKIGRGAAAAIPARSTA